MSVQYGGDKITFPDGSTVGSGWSGFKNRIINGAMMIDQRNAGASGTSRLSYTVDRWGFFNSPLTTYGTWGQNLNGVTPPAGFTKYLGYKTGASPYTIGASENVIFYQNIEGFNTADLAWGTANAQTVTLSFLVYSSLTGTFGGSLQNAAGNRSYPFSYSIPVANTWTTVSVTVAGDTSGTWVGATNGVGIGVLFALAAGSSVSGTAGSWAGAGYSSVTGSVSVLGTANATWYITGVQLEKGSTATSFDYRPYGTELQLCQRYFARFNSLGGSYRGVGAGVSESATSISCVVKYPVSMRSGPTASGANMATYDGSSVRAITAFSTQYTGSDGLNINLTVGGGGMTTNRPANLISDNSGTGYFDLSAEL